VRLTGNHNYIVGYDLGNRFSQISYCLSGHDEVETLSQVAGSENFVIPTVLCKRVGVNQWFYGQEALKYAKEQDGILITDLVHMAKDGEMVHIEEQEFDPVALLALFFKRSLSMLSNIGSPDRMDHLMITVENPDGRLVEVLNQVVGGLHLNGKKISYQSHTESYYSYMLYQPKELWQEASMLYSYQNDGMTLYKLECNKHTKPVVVYISEEHKDFPKYEPVPEEEVLREEHFRELDGSFLNVIQDSLPEGSGSSVYLIGEDFREEWLKDSLKQLCRGRRVFQGNNLFSKGAVYFLLNREEPCIAGKEHVFLGKDKLKTNIGMKVFRRGEESYMALLDAGVNWYDAEKTVEFYLRDGNEMEIEAVSLVGKPSTLAKVVLDDLKGDISRLRMKAYMKSENLMNVEITDLGFGEIRPSENKVWSQDITV